MSLALARLLIVAEATLEKKSEEADRIISAQPKSIPPSIHSAAIERTKGKNAITQFRDFLRNPSDQLLTHVFSGKNGYKERIDRQAQVLHEGTSNGEWGVESSRAYHICKMFLALDETTAHHCDREKLQVLLDKFTKKDETDPFLQTTRDTHIDPYEDEYKTGISIFLQMAQDMSKRVGAAHISEHDKEDYAEFMLEIKELLKQLEKFEAAVNQEYKNEDKKLLSDPTKPIFLPKKGLFVSFIAEVRQFALDLISFETTTQGDGTNFDTIQDKIEAARANYTNMFKERLQKFFEDKKTDFEKRYTGIEYFNDYKEMLNSNNCKELVLSKDLSHFADLSPELLAELTQLALKSELNKHRHVERKTPTTTCSLFLDKLQRAAMTRVANIYCPGKQQPPKPLSFQQKAALMFVVAQQKNRVWSNRNRRIAEAQSYFAGTWKPYLNMMKYMFDMLERCSAKIRTLAPNNRANSMPTFFRPSQNPPKLATSNSTTPARASVIPPSDWRSLR